MDNVPCPKCGQQTAPETTCPGCGSANGIAKPTWTKPPAPPEVANWVIYPVPPEIAEHFRQTFNEEEFLAEVRETLATGGADMDALIAELEQKIKDHG